ncbi:MAG: NAD(P)-binding domain-containing protein [Deltaproteobacteria bacterium]|nr:NAD(P)-binding domain-containing protein [Deltaproteobacteria bacterium]
MRYIIYGAGAIGGVIGARLYKAGKEAVLIARGAHFEAIQNKGLTLETPESIETLKIRVVSNPAQISFRDDDAVILAMKSQDTEGALKELLNTAGDAVSVVCTQNGVANERMALRRFQHVYAMVVMLPAMHMVPGVVEQNSLPVPGILDAGRYPEGIDATVETICADLRDAGFSAKPDAAAMRLKYTKLLMNLGNAFQVICGNDADGREILTEARKEAVMCYRAADIQFATDEEFRARRGHLITVKPVAEGRPRGSSSWQSAIRGTGTVEADWLNGEICLLGRLYGIPTPVNQLLQVTANHMIRDKLPPGTITPEELRKQLKL